MVVLTGVSFFGIVAWFNINQCESGESQFTGGLGVLYVLMFCLIIAVLAAGVSRVFTRR